MLLKNIAKKVLFFLPSSVIEHITFETKSYFGRKAAKRLKTEPGKKNYINLGSGRIYIKGFINIDFFSTPQLDYKADLRYPLLIDNETIDGIISEHTLEHLTYDEVDRLLGECYRVMKDGAVIRIIVPDVSIFVRKYAENDRAWFDKWEQTTFTNSNDADRAKRKLHTPMQAISFITQEYHHVACWDYETMKFYLEKNGFRSVEHVDFSKGKNPELLADTNNEYRRYISLYIEAEKPKKS